MINRLFPLPDQPVKHGKPSHRFRTCKPSQFAHVGAILIALATTSGSVAAKDDGAHSGKKPHRIAKPSNELSKEQRENKLAAALEKALGVPGMTVQVFIGVDGKKTAILSGQMTSDKAATAAIVGRAKTMVPSVVDEVISLLIPQIKTSTAVVTTTAKDPVVEAAKKAERVKRAADQIDRQAEVTALWTRTFAPTSLNSATNDDSGPPPPSDPDGRKRFYRLADALNEFHDSPKEHPYVIPQGSSMLYLRGPRAKVVSIKRDLLKLDAAWPQVQLDIWTVQLSGDSKSIAINAAAIREKFNRANQAMQTVKTLLGDAAQNPQYFDSSDHLLDDSNQGLLKSIGFNPNCIRPLSLTEMLIFLGLQTAWLDKDGCPITDCNGGHFYRGLLSSWSSFSTEDREKLARIHTIRKLQCQVAEKLNTKDSPLLAALDARFKNERGQAVAKLLLPSLLAAYSSNPASDRAGIVQFAQAAKNFRDADGTRTILEQETDIASLRATAAASDRLIKAATDAFASDMQEMFLQPIFDGVSKEAIKTNSGITLTGKARLVVTSRLETGIHPTVTSYVETTQPKPLDISTLKGFLGAPTSATTPNSTADATAATPAVAAGIPALGGLLSQPQLLLLGAALNPPDPEITRVAPGVSIHVRPTVLPDGGSARLQLDFNFGVATSVESASAGKSVLADGIASNQVKTDLTISAFELFNVSSFSIESSHPRSRYLPVIGSIPLLGELIKKPPKNKVTRHESLVLINAVILPRVLDLTHFYGD